MPTVQTPHTVDVTNPKDNQGQVPTETLDNKDEYRCSRLHFQVPSQATQPANMNQFQASPFGYPGETFVPILTYAPNNPALQYVHTGTPQAPNAQGGGQFPHMVHASQTVPPSFSYPPQMLFAPQSASVQVMAQDTSRPSSQVTIPAANPTRSADYQMLDDRIRDIKGFLAFGMDARYLWLVSNVVLLQKFKVPDLSKYKGLSCPRSHNKMYCRKMELYIDNDDLLIHCFQDSLSKASLDWYMGLERPKIRSWRDLSEAFLKQYK